MKFFNFALNEIYIFKERTGKNHKKCLKQNFAMGCKLKGSLSIWKYVGNLGQ